MNDAITHNTDCITGMPKLATPDALPLLSIAEASQGTSEPTPACG